MAPMLKLLPIKNDLRVYEKSIFRIVFLHGPLTKRQIQERTGGSLSTISRFLDALEENGLVIQDESRGRAAGARPGQYAVRPDAIYNYGAFISPDNYGIGLCDTAGSVLGQRERDLAIDTRPEEVFEFFAAFINECAHAGLADPRRVLGLGVASTGPIKKSKGLIFHPYHLRNPEWQIVPLKDMLSLKTGLPVTIDSFSETALLRELIHGPIRPIESAAYLWIDRGIGCAVYSHGTLGVGNIDMSASVGHTVIDFKGDSCRCGKRGCLETYAAVSSILKRLREAAGGKADGLRPPDELPRTDVVGGAAEELLLAAAILEAFPADCAPAFAEIAEALAVAFANFICITRPKTIFYAGRTAVQLPGLVAEAFRRMGGMLNDDSFQDINFVPSALNSAQVVQGAAFLSFNRQLEFVRKVTA
jgi:predicted NBD/HSP70 family sugar kinase